MERSRLRIQELSPGIFGTQHEVGDVVVIPDFYVKEGLRTRGLASNYLTMLEEDHTVVIGNVISKDFRRFLGRRGYRHYKVRCSKGLSYPGADFFVKPKGRGFDLKDFLDSIANPAYTEELGVAVVSEE